MKFSKQDLNDNGVMNLVMAVIRQAVADIGRPDRYYKERHHSKLKMPYSAIELYQKLAIREIRSKAFATIYQCLSEKDVEDMIEEGLKTYEDNKQACVICGRRHYPWRLEKGLDTWFERTQDGRATEKNICPACLKSIVREYMTVKGYTDEEEA